MALGSTSSAEKAGGAAASDGPPLLADFASPPKLPTGEAAADEYGMGAELEAGAALADLAEPAEGLEGLASSDAGPFMGAMALPPLTGA